MESNKEKYTKIIEIKENDSILKVNTIINTTKFNDKEVFLCSYDSKMYYPKNKI